MQENKPFIEDVFPCVLCGLKAGYVCPNCQLKYCEKCTIKKHGKPEQSRYCPKCLCRVYEIPLRFVGATGPQRKLHATPRGMVQVLEAPKIYPRSDRQKIQQQNQGDN